MRILVVDDDAIVRDRLVRLLGEEIAGVRCGHAADAESALEAITREPWDLVLLDVHLPDRTGLQLLPDLRAARPTLPVLMVSGMADEAYALAARRAGANGFVDKTRAVDELAPKVRALLDAAESSDDLATAAVAHAST
ncbi:response regulator transcription factor [Myxococcota bacterium]|nr:response regulator transcription factor [Myxococcota bacterium]